MTSNPNAAPFSFLITSADLAAGSLNRPGMVRPDKIYTLAQSLVVKKFAKVSPDVVRRIRAALESLTAP